MTGSAEDYVPQSLEPAFRRQAVRVWAIATSVVAAWVLLIVIDPLLKAAGVALASTVHTFFGSICHQIPERSFFIAGEPFGVCSRCFGVYFGLFSGSALYPAVRRLDDIEPLPRFWLFLSLIPITVDWSLTVFGIWENTHLSRSLTGLVLGFACALYLVPAAVEIVRNWTSRRRTNFR